VNLTRRIISAAVIGGLLAASALPGIALADPPEGGNASCMGYEAADVSPPGSTSGATNQFGMPGVMNLGIQGAVDAGIFPNRGAFVKLLAGSQLGSHEDCDAAFGLDPDTE
jgi:hypothetical protein